VPFLGAAPSHGKGSVDAELCQVGRVLGGIQAKGYAAIAAPGPSCAVDFSAVVVEALLSSI